MIRLTNIESALIDELLECVSEAIAQTDGISPQYANKTKLQKLLYFAIEEYDLPITYSWYLAGAVVPDTGITPNDLDTPQSPQSPQSIDESAASDQSDCDTVDQSIAEPEPDTSEIDPIMFSGSTDTTDETIESVFEIVDRSTLIDFYTTKLPDVWSQNTMRFLQNFYQKTAPPEYRSLYIESTHLRTHLHDLIETVDAHRKGEVPSNTIDELETQLGRTISDLHYYLREIEQLRETFDLVVTGTDLIEDAISVLSAMAPEEFTEVHVSALEELQDFFYYSVWRYPCLRISELTASGPSADTLATQQRQTFEEFPDRFQSAYTEATETIRNAGLYPDPTKPIEAEGDEVAKTLTDLSVEYLE